MPRLNQVATLLSHVAAGACHTEQLGQSMAIAAQNPEPADAASRWALEPAADAHSAALRSWSATANRGSMRQVKKLRNLAP